jgi:DEAD/DEAH box helicase domain-containing protein
VLTDRNDLGGISTTLHPQIKGPAVFIYDSTAGGAGLSRQAFIRADLLLDYTFKVISECPCETGCPSCVHSPKCGSGNRPIDKSAASFILSKLMTGSDFKHDDISLTQSVIPGLTRNPDFYQCVIILDAGSSPA